MIIFTILGVIALIYIIGFLITAVIEISELDEPNILFPFAGSLILTSAIFWPITFWVRISEKFGVKKGTEDD